MNELRATKCSNNVRLTAATGIALACLLALGGCLAPAPTLPTPTPWPTPTVSAASTFTVQRGTLIDQVGFTGEVAPLVWEPLSFPVEGSLAAIFKFEGETVEAGEVLAELEMPDQLEQLEQAQLALAQAEDAQSLHDRQRTFALERARLDVRRAEVLVESARDSGDESAIELRQIDLQLAQLALEEVEAGVDPTLARNVTQAQLAMEALQRQVETRRLTAPYAGQVIAVGIGLQGLRSAGERPQPHTPVPAYTPVMVVAQSEPLVIVVSGDAPRISEMTIGQQVTVTHYLARNEPFTGEVVALPVQTSNPVQQPGFPDKLQIALAEDHPPLNINDFVDITVLLAVHADTLVLPNAAVRRTHLCGDGGGGTFTPGGHYHRSGKWRPCRSVGGVG
jgi:multidrug efflux pump subunit AcrA (membrane-fusion protein)